MDKIIFSYEIILILQYLNIFEIINFSLVTKKTYNLIKILPIIKSIKYDGSIGHYWIINKIDSVKISDNNILKIFNTLSLNKLENILLSDFIPWFGFSKYGKIFSKSRKKLQIKIKFKDECYTTYLDEIDKFIKNLVNFDIEIRNYPHY